MPAGTADGTASRTKVPIAPQGRRAAVSGVTSWMLLDIAATLLSDTARDAGIAFEGKAIGCRNGQATHLFADRLRAVGGGNG